MPTPIAMTCPLPRPAIEHFVTVVVRAQALREEARRALEAGQDCTLFVGHRPDGQQVETLVVVATERAGQACGGSAVWGQWCEHGDEGHIRLDAGDPEGRALYVDLDGNEAADPLAHRRD